MIQGPELTGVMMSNPWARDRATAFYPAFGLLGLLVVAIGFGWTYAVPMVRQTFEAPWYVHLHGASALAWVLLFIAQPFLVRARRTPLHRRRWHSRISTPGLKNSGTRV